VQAITVQICKLTTRCQSVLQVIFPHASALVAVSVPVVRLVLPPLAVIAGVLGAWRLGSDAGWTSDFFIADGLLSRYQLWFAIAVGAQTSVLILDRWVANHNVKMPAIVPSAIHPRTPTGLGQLRPPAVI
jgi:hypothetical protein